MRVDVECRRRPRVGQSVRDDRDRDAVVQHLRRHEVTEVVKPKVHEVEGAATANECFCHPVRLPRNAPVWTAREDKAIRVNRFVALRSKRGERRGRRDIEGHSMACGVFSSARGQAHSPRRRVSAEN